MDKDIQMSLNTLNAARKAMGFSAQGITPSPTVLNNTLKQVDRYIGASALPKTCAALAAMLESKKVASEKVALSSMDEINSMRDEVRQRPTPLTDEELDAENEREMGGEAPGMN